MAKLFPNKLSGAVAPEILRCHRQLRKLPDSFSVWYNLSGLQSAAKSPQFLIIWEDRCAYLLHITSTAQDLVDTAIHGNLFDANSSITPESIGEEMQQILATFTQKLPDPDRFPIQSIVAFPNVHKGTLETISPQLAKDSGLHFLGKQQLNAEKLATFLIANAPPEISDPQLIQLRHQFTPEVTVPTRFSPLSLNRPLADSLIAPQLLDLDQEWCMKNNLYLPEEAQALASQNLSSTTVDEPDHQNEIDRIHDDEIPRDGETSMDSRITSQLVTGVAGSGKSLILLYRALLNAQLNPDAKVLILTHNRPIINELQARFDHLSSNKLNITWLTFFQWARRELSSEEWSEKETVLYPDRIEAIINDITRALPDNTFSSTFLIDEIGFLKDHHIGQLRDYLTLSRVGQSRGLTENQRRGVWKIFKQYQHHLESNHLTDWHNIAIRFHRKAMAEQCAFPRYHCILIDEAQFFAKAWFDIVKKALIPGGQLFLSADPTQGFLKRRQSWISSGIEVRGRTTKLNKAYRNSREILQFATDFYRRRQASDAATDDALNLLSSRQIKQAKSHGIHPHIIPTTSSQDSNYQLIKHLQQIAQEIKTKQLPAASQPSILIIHADSKQLKPLQTTLQQHLPEHYIHNIKTTPAPAHTFSQITTLNAATGLEASIVFLLGIDSLLGKENSPHLSPEERSDLITQHTRQLYMAFTRAAQSLTIFSKLISE